jgi:hypothetical protein
LALTAPEQFTGFVAPTTWRSVSSPAQGTIYPRNGQVSSRPRSAKWPTAEASLTDPPKQAGEPPHDHARNPSERCGLLVGCLTAM